VAKQVGEKKTQEAIEQLDTVRREWLRRPGVTGVDVGFKLSDGKLTDQVAIRVHVERKLPPEALAKHDVFSISGKAEKIGAFPVDVIEATYGPSRTPAPIELEDIGLERTGQFDPLVGGISVGNPRVTAGTLGAIVWDRTDCSVSILSNWHVLAGGDAAVAGEAIYQPGPIDGGTAADTVATLTRMRLDADMDAGIAKLNGARGYSRDIVGLSPIPGIDAPALGMEVTKSGRTTGVTDGVIDGVSFSGTITYDDHGPNTFHDQIHIVPRPPWPAVDYEVSRGGDSGSVWINEATGRAVGLHFGGETDPAPTSENALANPMQKVAAATGLNFSFTPLFCLRPPKQWWRDVPKPLFADLPPKSLLADLPPKSLIDPIKLPGFDVGLPLDPSGPVTLPGGPTPFAFSTPHHAAGVGGAGGREASLAELDAIIAQYQALRDRLAGE
jgi:endonuclease G